jgi:hypothetical protein
MLVGEAKPSFWEKKCGSKNNFWRKRVLVILLLFFLFLYIGGFQQQAADRSFRSLNCR